MIRERINKLRDILQEKGIDAYLIPSDDDHASEYVNDHFKFREWISGFTGSAGTVLITQDDAWLWTDGRYFLQAADELRGSGISLMKMGEPGVPSINRKLQDLSAGYDARSKAGYGSLSKKKSRFTLGFCGDTITASDVKALIRGCDIDLFWEQDIADVIWDDRPALVPSMIWEFPVSSCGVPAGEKLESVRAAMSDKGADILLISDLMETAWLFDLRGGDIQNTPVFYSYAIVTADECFLFTLPDALPDDIKDSLAGSGITAKDYSEVKTVLLGLCAGGRTLWADRAKTSYSLLRGLQENCAEVKVFDEPTPVEMMKAVKNDTEIDATRNAHLKDGIAVTKFIYWLKQNIGKAHLTEISCADKLESLRKEQDGCFDLSFPTISAYNGNGAIIHYEPTPVSDTALEPKGFLLVDSGGQYMDGTTDITRTIALGPLTRKMREYYTFVLKGHIALGSSVFDEGTTGFDLDKLARQPLQEHGLDYNHGTGHGVGHVLSVHEGPNFISKRNSGAAIVPGMITSNEPGVYIEGEFGIRLESEILCRKRQDGRLCFETLTLAPFDRGAILPDLLTEKERLWLNSYSELVRDTLLPYLDHEETDWLINETRPL